MKYIVLNSVDGELIELNSIEDVQAYIADLMEYYNDSGYLDKNAVKVVYGKEIAWDTESVFRVTLEKHKKKK